MNVPQHDTTRFLDDFRTAQISHLLTAAVSRFDVGQALSDGPLDYQTLRADLGLADRSASVLLTALRSIDLIEVTDAGLVQLTDYGREKMSPASEFHLRGYIGLGAFSADVQQMISCLEHDRPAGEISFVFHEDGPPSVLDDPQVSDMLTRAMSDRAKNVAPILAEQLHLPAARCLIDVGGAHGLYSYALLQKHPQLRCVIVDREPALRVAREFAAQQQLTDRVEFLLDDIHTMQIPAQVDTVLMANILHDYNAKDAQQLVSHFAQALPSGGKLMVLDSLLNRVASGAPPISDGPRAVAAYSALLFSICEGRCYRFDEIETWFQQAGLQNDKAVLNLPAHGSLLSGVKP
jgi:hypothetical protein